MSTRHAPPGSATGTPAPPAVNARPLPSGALAPLAVYANDPDVTDVLITSSLGLFVDRGDGVVRDPLWQCDETDVRALAVSLIDAGGRHIDEANPCVDVRLPGGERVHAVLFPVSTAGTALSIRFPRITRTTLDDLADRGAFPAGDTTVEHLRDLVGRRANILISGAAGAGKTTLLQALMAEVRPDERIVTIEDVAELVIHHPHHVSLEARQANIEGIGGLSLARLLREALRMRPDRLVLGECRGEEVRELLTALNTGHDGGAGTMHANSLEDVPARLEALGALAGMNDRAIARQAASAIDVILHVQRDASGLRRLDRIGRFTTRGDRLGIERIAA